ncbi:MAG: cation-translocating P-type ATPase, partial [Bacteroidota bacterium]
METINWKIDGMSCSTCALTISKYLEKKGLQNVKVSLASGDVSFDTPGQLDRQQLQKGIQDLGYTVAKENNPAATSGKPMNRHLRYLFFCLPFTVVLLLHMAADYLPFLHWLMHPWVQFGLCLPVYVAGMNFFGRSAIKSIANGLPNMNVLIAAGATAAFLYSFTGTLFGLGPDYQFYETAASIITIVFLGYYIEDTSVRTTQKALTSLVSSQKTMANMIAFDDQHQEQIFPLENTQLRTGDLVLVRSGEQVPADGKILWGEASVNEAILTGESLPLEKKAKDTLVGGSLLVSGVVKVQVTAAAADSVLAGIVRMVKQAQGEKPPIQQLADKISAVFVPAVLIISLLVFGGNYWAQQGLAPSLMRAIGVLVIACPCAMGLATPAAIAVGLGRAARQGILFRNAKSLESFKNIRQVVFDKTGTLTTGNFSISDWRLTDASITPEEFRQITFSLEKYSNHPIARSITAEWRQKNPLYWTKMEELKGLGMSAWTKTGDSYLAGSYKMAAGLTTDDSHNVYIVRNNQLLGWIDVKDTLRPEAAAVIQGLHKKGIHTILLSGDRQAACDEVAEVTGIQEVLAEQTPAQKLEQIIRLNGQIPTAMVGDGINDAPALAAATIGISMSDASQLAMQTADVVLLGHGLQQLPTALELGKHTFGTIRQNLFWAFFYN